MEIDRSRNPCPAISPAGVCPICFRRWSSHRDGSEPAGQSGGDDFDSAGLAFDARRRVGFFPASAGAADSGGGGAGRPLDSPGAGGSIGGGGGGTAAGGEGGGAIGGVTVGSGVGGGVGAAGAAGGGVATGAAGAAGGTATLGAVAGCAPWWVELDDGFGVIGVNSPGFHVWGMRRIAGSFRDRSA